MKKLRKELPVAKALKNRSQGRMAGIRLRSPKPVGQESGQIKPKSGQAARRPTQPSSRQHGEPESRHSSFSRRPEMKQNHTRAVRRDHLCCDFVVEKSDVAVTPNA